MVGAETQDETQKNVESVDWVLAELVQLANQSEAGFEVDITLTVSGSIISGKLVEGKEYFEYYGDYWAKSFDGEVDKKKIKERFGAPEDWFGPKGSIASDQPSYIYLRDAKYFYPNANPIPADSGLFWRGKLSSVDGFSMGSLSAVRASVD